MFEPHKTQEYFVGGDLERLLKRIDRCEQRYRELAESAGFSLSEENSFSHTSDLHSDTGPGQFDLFSDTSLSFQIPLNSIVNIAETILDEADKNATPLSRERIAEIASVISNMSQLRNDYNDFYGTIKKYNRILEQKVLERTDELNQKKLKLEKALMELTQSQSRLIQSEKMAALGQLIAGIAHEINTPLSVIRGACSNVSNNLDEIIAALPKLFQILSENKIRDFIRLLHYASDDTEIRTARETRMAKRNLVRQLEEAGIPSPARIADTLVDTGILDAEPFLPLLNHSESAMIVKTAYCFSNLTKNSRNISSAVDKAHKMVFSLKKFVHKDHEEKKVPVNVIESIETVLTLYYNRLKQGIDVRKNYGNIPLIHGYQDELNQIWTNLIQNALYAMKYKGVLDISVKRTDNQISVSITDNGPGIPEEIKSEIFKPFFTTKPPGEGSGLGLDICRKIIHKHKGKIKFGSSPGRTTFRVLLPVSDK